MIFWILAGLGGVLLLGSRGRASMAAAQSPVIQQATGASLTKALGNVAKPAGYYQSGNPGYSYTPAVGSPVSNRPVSHVSRKPVVLRSSQPGQIAPVRIVAGTSSNYAHNTQQVPHGVVKPILSNFVNVRQMNRSVTAPELAQAFWTPNPRIPRRANG